jgi:hypothetical protein
MNSIATGDPNAAARTQSLAPNERSHEGEEEQSEAIARTDLRGHPPLPATRSGAVTGRTRERRRREDLERRSKCARHAAVAGPFFLCVPLAALLCCSQCVSSPAARPSTDDSTKRKGRRKEDADGRAGASAQDSGERCLPIGWRAHHLTWRGASVVSPLAVASCPPRDGAALRRSAQLHDFGALKARSPLPSRRGAFAAVLAGALSQIVVSQLRAASASAAVVFSFCTQGKQRRRHGTGR